MKEIPFSDLELIASGNYTMRELSIILEIDKEEIKNVIKKYKIVYNTRGYIKWTNRDDKLIYDMKNQGYSNSDIAKALGIKVSKVNQRRLTLGITDKQSDRAWTTEDDKHLIFMKKMGNVYKDIGYILDRGRYACSKRYNQLKKEGKV